MLLFDLIKKILHWLFVSHVLKRKTGAAFANSGEYRSYLNTSNQGLLLDGQRLCLSEKESFQNICIIARVGAGKTSRYIIPNVLHRAKKQCSMVINDPKGEVFDACSGYLKSRGFRIIVINPEDPLHSARFNPLAEARNDVELDQIAEIIIKAGNTESKSDFWNQGAVRFVSLFLRTLKIAEQSEPNVNNLANLYYLFQNFGEDGSQLDAWMAKNTVIPNDENNPLLWNEWKGVLTGNKEGVQSLRLRL